MVDGWMDGSLLRLGEIANLCISCTGVQGFNAGCNVIPANGKVWCLL